MKHVVFLVGSYYPYYSAVGRCIGNVAEELEKDNKVTVICFESRPGQLNTENYKNHAIVRVSTKTIKKRNRLEQKIKDAHGLNKAIAVFGRYIRRGINFLIIIFSAQSLDKYLMLSYTEALKKLRDIDIIVPACSPFESVLASIEYKKTNPAVKIKPFIFDKFSKNATLHRTRLNRCLKMRRHLALEKTMAESSDKIIHVEAWTEHLHKHFPQYMPKFILAEHPLLKPLEGKENCDFDKNKVNIVYTGVLNRKVRPPGYTMKLFSDLCSENVDLMLHLYTLGNCEKIIKYYCDKHPGQLISYGSVSKQCADAAIKSSGFLLSIGNRDISQIPSKLFEYFSCGKPIIHLYINGNDPAIRLLSKYPLAICLKQDRKEFVNNKTKIMDFIHSNKDKTVPFKIIKKEYREALPEYAARYILE